MTAIQVASLYGVLNLQDNMTPGLKNADRETKSFGSRVRELGGNIQSFGAKVTVLTAPVSAGLGVAINSSRTFSRTMSNVNSILGISGTQAADLRAKLLAYGGDTVAGPQKVAEAYYDIVSGVADASTHMAILDAATKTSEAGQADLKATTSALISTMNAYQFGADDAAHVSDVFTRAVQTGVLTMDEMASAFPQVTGLAAQFGLNVDDMAGSLSYLTTKGFSASQSATYMRGMITTLLNPTTKLDSAIHSLGYESGQALLEGEGLTGAYKLLSEQNGGLAGLVTNQEALTGSLVLTGDTADQFLTNFKSGIDGATESARGIQNETAGWDLFTSKIQQLAITVGDQLAPILLSLLTDNIMPLINGVITWAQANPQLFNTITMVVGALTLAGPVLMSVGAAIAFLASPIGLIIAGVGALGAAFVAQSGGMEQAWQRVTGFLSSTWAIVSPVLTSLYDWFMNVGLPVMVDFVTGTVIPGVQSFIDQLAGVWAIVSPILTSLFGWFMETGLPLVNDFITNVTMPAVQGFIDLLLGIWNAVSPILGTLLNWFISDGLPLMGDFINGTIVPIVQGFTDLLAGIWDIVGPGLEIFKNNIGGIFQWIADNVLGPFLGTVSDILGTVNDVLSGAANLAGGALSSAGDFLSSLNPFGGGQSSTQTAMNNVASGNITPAQMQAMYQSSQQKNLNLSGYGIGGHAGGGMVKANVPVLVGERGPELFTPSTSGTINNNPSTHAAMAGAGGDTFQFYGDIVTPNPDDFMRQLEERRRRRR